MRIVLVVLSLCSLLLCGRFALADEGTLIWKSSWPTAHVIIRDGFGETSIPCFATRRKIEGKIYVRNIECPSRVSQYSDIALPADGCLNRAMCSGSDIRRARRLKNGMIQLR